MPSYITKKWLNDATDVGKSNVAVKINFTDLKAEIDNYISINWIIFLMNNWKAKMDRLNVGELRIVPKDLKKTKWCSEYRICDTDSDQQIKYKSK